MKLKHWPRSMWGPQAFLDDNTCELLASIGPVESESYLSSILEASWEWWDKHGNELFMFLQSLDIPALPQTSRGTKRLPAQLEDLRSLTSGGIHESASVSKRARTAATSAQSVATTSTIAPTAPRTRRTREQAPMEFAPSLYDNFWSSLSNTTK